MAKKLLFLRLRSAANEFLSHYEPVLVFFLPTLFFLVYRFCPFFFFLVPRSLHSVLSLPATAIKLILGLIRGDFHSEEQQAVDESKFRDKYKQERICSGRSEVPERDGRWAPAPTKAQTINGEEIRSRRRSSEGRSDGRNRGRSCSDDDDGDGSFSTAMDDRNPRR